jgi:4-amino-4-deoxy-L-arabinose transferase-like glycosyltransferase
MNKKFLIILGIISFIAFLIRIQVSHELMSVDPQVANPSSVTDMFTYKDLSEKILKGEFKQVFYYQPFYYAVFLPVIKYCFGYGIWPVIVFQCILSALTVWFSGLSAYQVRGHKAGIITALLLTFSTILILYTPYYLIATLQAFWVSLIFYLCLRYISKYRYCREVKSGMCCFDAGVLGAVVGASILTRGNIWFFVPGIIMILISGNKNHNYYKRLSIPVIFLIFMILPQIPFTWNNTKIKGSLTGPSTAAGAVLSLGNTPESPPGGREPGTGPGPMEYPDTRKAWSAEAEKISVFSRIFRWFAREPLAFTELQLRKMLLFWDYREIPNNIAIESQGVRSNILCLIGFIPVKLIDTSRGALKFIACDFVPMSFLILGFGLAGSVSSFCRLFSNGIRRISNNVKRRPAEYLLLYFIVAYWLATAAFYILARFRVPTVPLLAVSAAIFICRSYDVIFKKRRGKIVMQAVISLIFSFFTVLYGYSLYRYGLESKIMSVIRPQGVHSELNDGILLVRDNGPQSFGSWRFLELKEGRNIEKGFSMPDVESGDNTAILKLDLYWKIPGIAVLSVNGKKFTLRENIPGRKVQEFKLNKIPGGKVIITPERLDCTILCFIDMQRNYGRTTVEHKSTGGELVSAVYIKGTDKNSDRTF